MAYECISGHSGFEYFSSIRPPKNVAFLGF